MKQGKYLLGVIGAEVHGIEQRQILSGIIERAQQENAHVAVFSNIFNPLEPEHADCCENQIFDLIMSPDIDAIIMLSESFVNERLREKIRERLLKRSEIPVVLVGSSLPGFNAARFPHISTSDANDIEEITAHFIEEHGYQHIDLLTGPLSLEVSRTRIEGYRRALEAHGIVFDSAKVHEGNFWYTSGEALSKRYLIGELPMPEALVCANDYMAFGVLDAFEYAGINILERMALVGYEFIPERNLHTPLLTTYQRNRKALGVAAAERMLNRLRGNPNFAFSPPKGRLIHGVTCGCSVACARQHEELITARLNKQYADWNLKSDLERQLTECIEMDAFAHSMGDFLFMVRAVDDAYLCLFEDWYHRETASSSDVLLCRSVKPWTNHSIFRLNRLTLSGITARVEHPAAFYFTPLFFKDKLFGYCVLQYNQPDTYDDSCRNWIKSISNGLEFLRLKADVQYLLQCRTLSGSYDSMTGMFNADGLQNAYRLMQNVEGLCLITAVLLRLCTETEPLYSAEDAKPMIDKLIAGARVLQSFQGSDSICGRISEFDFLLLLPIGEIPPHLLKHAILAELLATGVYANAEAFLCIVDSFPCNTKQNALLDALEETAEMQMHQLAAQRMNFYLSKMSAIHNTIYRHPTDNHSIEQAAAALDFNVNYYNRKYKACFGVSFHQDCIRSRIFYASHLLLNTNLTVAQTSECCGYTDSKYFIRQFSAVTGSSPRQFRSMLGALRE